MTVRMTWPQYCRRQVEVDGHVIDLSPSQCEVAMVLLMRPDPVPIGDLIEAIWPNPDLEPEYETSVLLHHIRRMRKRGIPVVNLHGRGYAL